MEKATYYQFLKVTFVMVIYQFISMIPCKGSYSDSMIAEMSMWPPLNEFKHLSILQDPFPRGAVTLRKSFAQPIVFFSLMVIKSLAVSPVASSLTHVRIRVPLRPVFQHLLTQGSFPNARVLDLGTTALDNPLVSLPNLLSVMNRIRHLLLDDCYLSREGWKDLGRALAVEGLSRANSRESAVKKWVEENSSSAGDTVDDGSLPLQSSTSATRRPHKGRKGLASATFSIRSRFPPRQPAPPTAPRPQQVSMDRIRILPPIPQLESLSTTLSPKPDTSKRLEWRNEFASGWLSGVATVRAVWTRLQASFRAGNVRLMRFDESYIPRDLQTDEPDGLLGLLDVDLSDGDFWEWDNSVPTICFGARNLHPSKDVNIFGTHTRTGVSTGTSVQSDLEDEDDHEFNCGHARFGNSWDLYTRIDLDE